MPSGVLNEKQLAMVTRVLDAYCSANRVTAPEMRLDFGEILLRLFERGARTELQLSVAFEEALKTNGLMIDVDYSRRGRGGASEAP